MPKPIKRVKRTKLVIIGELVDWWITEKPEVATYGVDDDITTKHDIASLLFPIRRYPYTDEHEVEEEINRKMT